MHAIRTALSIRTLLPGHFYLLFPELVTLGFVFADGDGTSRLDLNGKQPYRILPIGHERCIERFKGDELSIQVGQSGAQSFNTGSMLLTRTGARPFLAIQLPEAQRFVYIDLHEWKLADTLPDALFEVHNEWKFLRGWDGMLVHEFNKREQLATPLRSFAQASPFPVFATSRRLR